MRGEPTDRFFGQTISEHISGRLAELESDAVALGSVTHVGREGYGLEGKALVDFVRGCLTAMVSYGARPVLGGGDTGHFWVLQPQYGDAPRDIVEAVVAEWLASGGGDPDLGGLWFALPPAYEARWK